MNKKPIGQWQEHYPFNKSVVLPSIKNHINKNFKERADFKQIINYLKKGKNVLASSRIAFPNIFTGEVYSGALCYRTDGEYLWPDDLVMYMEKHDIGLPDYFIEHILKNEYQPLECD